MQAKSLYRGGYIGGACHAEFFNSTCDIVRCNGA